MTIAPHDLDAERAVLGAPFRDAEVFPRVRSILTPAHFYRRPHAQIFRAQIEVSDRGEPIDLFTVKASLERTGILDDVGGPAYIASLPDGVPRSLNCEWYARRVRDKAAERAMLDRMEIARVQIVAGRREAARAELQTILDESPGQDDELIIEPVSSVAARLRLGPPEFLVPGFLPRQGITLVFGDPRTFKSLALRALAVAVARGDAPAFGMERLRTGEPQAVVYLTEEDSPAAVLEHFEAFSDGAAGRGDLPLYLSACRGLTLDDAMARDRIVRQAAMCGAALVIIEPLRSLSAAVDQGPRELQPLTAFLRRLQRETGAAVLLGHHSVKRQAGADARTGAHRLSGGGLWSIADAPIEFSRQDDRTVVARPTSWKSTADPPALSLNLELEGGRVRRVVADEYAAMPTIDPLLSIESRIIDALAAPLHTRAIFQTVKARKDVVQAALLSLANRGVISRADRGRQVIWSRTSTGGNS